MKKVFLSTMLLIWLINMVSAQSTFIHRNSHTGMLINRYELLFNVPSSGDASTLKPYTRNHLKLVTDSLKAISSVDKFNLSFLRDQNLPYYDYDQSLSKRRLPLSIYKTKSNFWAVNKSDFKLYINPGFNFAIGKSSINDKPLYNNTRSVELRGLINEKLAFYTQITENQLRSPYFEKEYFDSLHTLPGTHLVKKFKEDGFDYFTATGYITFKLMPAISIQFGQDRNFIGNGVRSLLLSDFAADYLFLKINTRIWRINYQNLYAKLVDRYGPSVSPWPSKYMAAHYLGMDITKNLNLGFFETVTFHDNRGTGRGFDLYYLNPIIFYRSVEHLLGDADKMMVGLNVSWIPFSGIQLYSQIMVNEFRINDLRAGLGNANDKFGYQIGLKYYSIASIKYLDLNIEYNRVRPYSYAHRTIAEEPYPVNSYSHFNQPLAHPLGANFYELIAKIQAQPLPRLNIELNLIAATYGADSSGSNWGQNIFLDYRTYVQELGNYPAQGVKTSLSIIEFITSWHLRHNLFIDLNVKYRHLNSEIDLRDNEELYIGTALRLNLDRKRWEY